MDKLSSSDLTTISRLSPSSGVLDPKFLHHTSLNSYACWSRFSVHELSSQLRHVRSSTCFCTTLIFTRLMNHYGGWPFWLKGQLCSHVCLEKDCLIFIVSLCSGTRQSSAPAQIRSVQLPVQPNTRRPDQSAPIGAIHLLRL